MGRLAIGPVGLLARLVLALAVAYGAWHAPSTVRALQDQASAREGQSRLEKELAPARATDIDERILERARELIPSHAVYYVATGDAVRLSTPVTLDAVRAFAPYWLLPRRATLDPARADWVLSYGGDLTGLGLRYRRVVRVDAGLEIAEVAR